MWCNVMTTMAYPGELLSQNSYLNFTSKSYSIDSVSKSCNLVQGQWFCDFCSMEIFKSKKQWSHNIQKSCHSFETIIAMNGHSARRGCQHHHLFVPGHYLLCQHEEGNYSLLRHKKKRFPYKKCPWELNWKFSSLNLASATLPPTTSLRLDNLERLS